MGFFAYDLETTGISPAFDQARQSGRMSVLPMIERINLRRRIAPHII
jgi:exodeoxyribonuclease-1